MIDPVNIVNYNYTDNELQELLVFCVCVAGKTAKTIAPKVHSYCGYHPTKSPFQLIYDDWGNNFQDMYKCKLGKYTTLTQAFAEMVAVCKWKGGPKSADIDLRKCTIEELESITGIGPKTSRFFIMSSRPNVRYAALDTHVLGYLNRNGISAPKSTPSSKKQYKELEQKFLELADKSGKSPAEFDLSIWNMYARK
jgi:thermostable 8-oxoguanine DNA glycosylase